MQAYHVSLFETPSHPPSLSSSTTNTHLLSISVLYIVQLFLPTNRRGYSLFAVAQRLSYCHTTSYHIHDITFKLASLRKSKGMPTDAATCKFLYTILKQLDLKSVGSARRCEQGPNLLTYDGRLTGRWSRTS